MDHKITYIESRKMFIVRTQGRMSPEGFIAMGQSLLDHSLWEPGGNVIFDHTSLDFRGLCAQDLRRIRAFHQRNEDKIGNGKSAMVLNPGSLEGWHDLWAQGRKIQTGNDVKIFERYDDDMEWVLRT